ncbi:MAG: C39 family peptidase [Oscillospiraceae bacterium]|nr:C39 family peptidase [Oscillospiraceae bacterium]
MKKTAGYLSGIALSLAVLLLLGGIPAGAVKQDRGWHSDSNGWYFINSKGKKLSGWFVISDVKYLFDEDGYSVRGWKRLGDKYCYLRQNERGGVCTGWKTIKGDRYYFGEQGIMATGWKKIGDKDYFFRSDGKLDPSRKRLTKQIKMNCILQYPELPTGCEVTSLTMLLNHMGFSVTKLAISRKYLPKMDFVYDNGRVIGADFHTVFAGDPESKHQAYGCYAPCITETANAYFKSKNKDKEFKAHDITGTAFDDLLTNYIDKDIPVLIWITSDGLHPSFPTDKWTTADGKIVQWIAYEHCVVLTGYDKDNDLVYVADPLVGNTSYSLKTLRLRYIELGQQAVYIEKTTTASAPKKQTKRVNMTGGNCI